uniref:heterogeneous nuclear ribonucleoprotein 1-like n=1 Tax=Erigeron canadensis TaxID=72917 RepID=UPI001CB8CDF9|nr:heterogeneous nuclear ribonucleoprotein 1-like [Erigeron canadensis]XP_043621594.1 heterogeneous nuclear ribonucleoprotein 1-like [Erigeron canadensis]XP_043621595.1 heterogeneous nuclear ribonucleoprotein 1-like [Erigeron canadensis]
MQSDLGKLFIGGIAWDTNEERLKDYFTSYGEVIEAVIMRDHATGRARGFGFIVFSDPVVADRVTKEKHNIDGRMVEAKKAVPREDQSPIRSSSSFEGSPGPARTRKIFVGGLASTVTENDFRKYFEQYGTITDVVVMYDHSTQRPRGFGFITFDSENAVDKVLLKTFHELNGKMVEVKRAVPKELSPSPIRSSLGAYPYGLSRASSFLNGAYSPNAVGVGGYGVRMDGRFSPIPSARSGFATFGSGYGMGLNFEPGMNENYGSGANYNSTLSYGRGMGPYYVGNSNRFGNPVSFEGGNAGNTSFFSSNPRNLWGNGGLNYASNSTGSAGVIGGAILGNTGLNWSSSPISSQGLGNVTTQSANLGYGGGENNYGLRSAGYGRNTSNSVVPTSSFGANLGYDGPFTDFYGGGGSVYGGDPTWRSTNNEREPGGSFGGYGLGGGGSDVQTKSPSGYVGGYSVAKRQENRGIAG